jgi:hypothetical protein
MSRECQKNQFVAAYAARSRRLARRALMIRIASASPLLLNVYATMSTCPPADRPSRRNRDLRRRVLEVGAIECLGIQEDRHGVLKRDAMLRRVGLSLPRVPLQHAFRIYEMRGPAGGRSGHIPVHTDPSRRGASYDGLQLGTPIALLITLVRDHSTAAMAQLSWPQRLDDVRVPERVPCNPRDAVAPSKKEAAR